MEKITREKFYEIQNVDEMMSTMESDLVMFNEELAGIDDVEKLKELEAELMLSFDENDEYIKNVKYHLSDSGVVYDDTKQSCNDVKKNIIRFINQIEVDFRSTLAIYQAVRFWKENTDNEIPYHYYESTLRLLGILKFKGATDCRDVIMINNWMAPAHESYKRDTSYLGFLASMHNAILERMKALNSDPEEQTEE